MGCDVHCYVEVKVRATGKWELYNQPRPGRNYQLFARMANVRPYDSIVPISEPRGVPNDISDMVRMEMEFIGADAHSHSWLSGSEVDELDLWVRDNVKFPDSHCVFGYVLGNGFGIMKEDTPYDAARLVFWFDN